MRLEMPSVFARICEFTTGSLPNFDHIRVYPLQFLLRCLEGVWRRVEFIGFKALVGESDFEGLVIFLFGQCM